jgi:predicted MFS family arabinose efflux permease
VNVRLFARVTDVLGGPERRRVIVLLGAVLALSFADTATVGAVATQLEGDLKISNTQLGLLPAVSALTGALFTLPAGLLVDRLARVRMLAISILLWSLASVVGALAVSYTMLLITRIALGAVVATATPAISSLTGDLFAPEQRARVYGFVLSGELLGAGLGFAVGGTLAGALTWRAAFAWLGIPGVVLAWALVRYLPEPARGGADRLAPRANAGVDEDVLHEQLHRRGVRPVEERILREDAARMPLGHAVRWILSIPTNRLLIVSSALGYFFFSGVQTFAVVFLRHRFGLGQAPASALLLVVGAGAVVGVLTGGRVADSWAARGRLDARIVVGGGAYLLAAAILVPGLLVGTLAVALPLLVLAVAALGAANPAVDAARLDVVPGRLWGRAEGVRTMLRQLATAFAPIAFGLTADAIAGGRGGGALEGAKGAHGEIHLTFLVMLGTLVAGGLILVLGRRSFPGDVATAEAAWCPGSGGPGGGPASHRPGVPEARRARPTEATDGHHEQQGRGPARPAPTNV